MAIAAAKALNSIHLTPETPLQLAPGVRTRFNAAGHVLLDAPDGTVVDLGPRGYATLSLFAQPLALGEAIERLEREAPSTDFAPTMNVVNMLIEPLRGRGLGRTLMAGAEAEARRRGCTLVQFRAYDLLVPGLYERLGYETVGVIEGCPAGSTARWYRKDL